jgi:hypothetical protein
MQSIEAFFNQDFGLFGEMPCVVIFWGFLSAQGELGGPGESGPFEAPLDRCRD